MKTKKLNLSNDEIDALYFAVISEKVRLRERFKDTFENMTKYKLLDTISSKIIRLED